MLHDVFICHASEDKDNFARPLAEALRAMHVEVWYDEFTLSVGDSLREAIDRGLANSRFGIVVLSPAFFSKRWTQRELNGLVAREMHEGRELVLPIWHGVGPSEIIEHSPPMADVFAINSAIGVEGVVEALLKKLRPEGSPLIVARDFLINKGLTPLIVTDEWWLDVVEFKEGELRYPDLNANYRWIFPLPYDAPDRGAERGLNIAWTALQMDWMHEGKEQKFCQLTNPERIHKFLREWPGLLECARNNPDILALYTPQLTIPGFDEGLSDVFDDLLKLDYRASLHFFGYSEPDTIGGEGPLCGEAIAWRHPQFGNYTNGELASSFVSAHTHSYDRTLHNGFTCLVWLLSTASGWLPESHKSRLLDGLRTKTYHWSTSGSQLIDTENSFLNALWQDPKKNFKFSREIRAGLEELIQAGLNELGSSESSSIIAKRFIASGVVEGYFDEHRRIRDKKSR